MAGLAALALPASTARGIARPTTLEPPDIFPRSSWAQDRPARGPMSPETVRFLLVHHTAGQTEYSQQGAIEQMRIAYDFHTGPEKGWPDVAYNFFIDRFGRVFEGRSGSLDGPVQADATGGSQGFAQLVCLLGDFTSVMPTDAALGALAQTLAWLAGRYGIDTTPGATVEFVSRGSNLWPEGQVVRAATISGHRDMSQTACPGDTFYPYLEDKLSGVVHGLRTPPTTAPPPSSTTSSTTTSTTTTVPDSTSSTSTSTSATVSDQTTTTARVTTTGPPTADVQVAAPTQPTTAVTGSTVSSPREESQWAAPGWWMGGAAALAAGLVSIIRLRDRA